MNSDIIRPEDFQTFTFNDGSEVRVIVENGQPLFMANDVCTALEYGNPWDAIGQHCKKSSLVKREVATKYGNKPANFLDESNLYRLIMRSKMDKAVEFQDWVCEVVLPAIRKTGKYEAQPKRKTCVKKEQPIPDVPLYRLNDIPKWLRENDNAYKNENINIQTLLSNLTIAGFVYKDVNTGRFVPTNHSIDNDFARNIPIKQMVTFSHDGKTSTVYTQYTFGFTEKGLREYIRIIYREARKVIAQRYADAQNKLTEVKHDTNVQ